MATITVNNFQGRLTRYENGDINSGLAKYATTFGNDPFSIPGKLTWFEQPTRIDSAESVITDLIVAARPRLESGITYVYAVGHTGRVYKIQVNSPPTFNPNFDSPVLLATLTVGAPTFKYAASINFFGTTERLYIGHDLGFTRLNFDGTNETWVGTVNSVYTTGVPRPAVNFLGKLYGGNGTNLVEIDPTPSVLSYGKLSPAFPVGTQVRDIDVAPDGNYAQVVVSRIAQNDTTTATQDTTNLSSADSYFIKWNGVDAGYTSYNPYNSYSLNANTSFGPYSYTFGYDLGGAAVYSNGQKVITLPDSLSPHINALFSTGNMVGFLAPEQSQSVLKASLLMYGQYDNEIPEGLYRPFRISATAQTDIIQAPLCVIVSNLFFGSSSAGYANNRVGSAKIYFSTFETDAAPTSKYKLYKFTTVPTGSGTAIAGVYETQTQIFSQKMAPKEIRLYTEPFVANNAFTVALIGSDGEIIPNSSQTFTVGTNIAVGDDFCWYNPAVEPLQALGIRITNSGSANWRCNKMELDYRGAGK